MKKDRELFRLLDIKTNQKMEKVFKILSERLIKETIKKIK